MKSVDVWCAHITQPVVKFIDLIFDRYANCLGLFFLALVVIFVISICFEAVRGIFT